MTKYVVAISVSLCIVLSAWATSDNDASNVPGPPNPGSSVTGLVRSGSTEIRPDGATRRLNERAVRINEQFGPNREGSTDREILLNPGFETGSLSPWYQAGSQWSVVTDNPHGGTYCAYDTGNNWIRQDFTGVPGASITSITVWVRQPDAAIAAIDLFYTDGSDSEDVIRPTASWQQFEITWLERGKTLNGIRLWGFTGTSNPETYYDDVSIQVTSSDTLWRYGPFSNFGLTRFDGEYFPGTGKVYFLGGRKADASTDGTVYSYDVTTRTYATTGATLTTPVSNYEVALLLDNYDLPAGDTWGLYIFGGRVGDGTFTSAVQAYHPRSNRVTTVSTDPYPNNTGGIYYIPACNAVHDNMAFVLGGFQSTSSPYISNAVWVFDPLGSAGTRWFQLPNLTIARGYIQAVVLDTFLYACGGDTFDGTNLYARNQVQRLNLEDPATWTLVAPMPQPCGEAKAFGFGTGSPYYRESPGDLDNKIIIAGHGNWPAEDSLCFLYDAAANTWGNFPRILRGRRNHAGAFIPGDAMSNGVPGIWIWGGRHTSDAILGDTTEYFALQSVGTGVAAQPPARLDFSLSIAPNPFRDRATVNYSLTRASHASLKLYDVTGKLVRVLMSGYQHEGSYSYRISDSGRGIYLLKFSTESSTCTRKLVVN